MPTPVIIPAFEAVGHIGATLESLPRNGIEPIVAVNGPDDGTIAIARRFGAQVLSFTEQGKMPAVQATLKSLGDRALEPVLLLDADTRPFFPNSWHKNFVETLTDPAYEGPVGAGGPVLFTSHNFVNSSVRSARRAIRARQTEATHNILEMGHLGPNMSMHLKTQAALDAIMAIKHYWPGEDRAIAYEIIQQGGTYIQRNHPSMLVRSPASASFIPLLERLRIGQEPAREKMRILYGQRGAPGSVPFIVPASEHTNP